eukprot:s2013_g11.t1
MPVSVAKPVVASRVKWEHSPSFDPIPFLTDPIVKDAFIDPANVRLPAEKWVDKPKGRLHCSKSELLKLAKKWDTKGACRIFRVDEIQADEAVGIFTVPKDEQFDRLILNPQRVNARLQSYSHFTKSLAPGSLFSLIRLEEDQVLRLSADDLAEMYYTVKIPEARAKRNCIGIKFRAHELSHLSCFDPDKHFGFCFVALNALAMGDSWAVEFAQQAHHNVLRFVAGCMLDHERVAYRKSFPRSLFTEWLSIDDHIGAQVLTRNEFQNEAKKRDTEVFERAGEAYLEVGLVQHPKKKHRGVLQGTFLGAEVDGDKGLVSAPRDRIASLMLCTMLVARKGSCSPKLLSSLLGCWIHVLMFRRPILAVLSHSFSEGLQRPQNQVFQLSRETRNELCALALLGPVCCSDMRVDVAPVVFCTDASPAGGGICLAEESKVVVAELWRHSEQRGYYTQLLNPSAAILAELGLEHLDDDLPDTSNLVRDSSIRVPAPLHEGILFDCLELFCGEGNWSQAHAAEGFRVHEGIDVKGSSLAFQDMLDDHVFHQLVSLAARRVVRDWHAGPPCYTYGTLRRPRIRSKTHPAGFKIDDPLTREQTRLALRTAFLMFLVVQSGLFFSVEQPGSSVMFRLQIFKRLVFAGCVITRMCFCAFGSPFKKPSQWLHNKPWLLEFETPCCCSPNRGHFVIEGSFTHESIRQFDRMCIPSAEKLYGRQPSPGEPVSSFSASYPRTLCRRMAVSAKQSLNDSIGIIPFSEVVRSCKRIDEPLQVPRAVLAENSSAPRPFHEDPEWVEELADSLQFRELLRYRFTKPGHINVLESRVHKTWLKYCAKHHANSRILALLDSRVTLGATAKGRSSSKAICRVLQGSLGYIIGGGLYPGGLHIGSKFNRSDGPSRNRPVPAPSKDEPAWLLALRQGKYDQFDLHLMSSQFPRCAGRWLRLLLLLCGDIEPNPGPWQQAQRVKLPRGALDMSVGFAPATSKRMSSCLRLFEAWLQATLHVSLEQIGWDTLAAPLAARAYGMHLYSQGEPRYLFVYTLTGLQDAYPHLRAFNDTCMDHRPQVANCRAWRVPPSHFGSGDESFDESMFALAVVPQPIGEGGMRPLAIWAFLAASELVELRRPPCAADQAAGTRSKRSKDKQAGKQRGFIIRAEVEESPLTRVVPWFKDAAKKLMDCAVVSRVDADEAANLKKAKKKDKANDVSVPNLGANECRIETTSRIHHFAHGPGYRVEVSEGVVAQRLNMFTGRKEIPLKDWLSLLLNALESTGTHVMILKRSGKEVVGGAVNGQKEDGEKKIQLKKDKAQQAENEWLQSLLAGQEEDHDKVAPELPPEAPEIPELPQVPVEEPKPEAKPVKSAQVQPADPSRWDALPPTRRRDEQPAQRTQAKEVWQPELARSQAPWSRQDYAPEWQEYPGTNGGWETWEWEPEAPKAPARRWGKAKCAACLRGANLKLFWDETEGSRFCRTCWFNWYGEEPPASCAIK